MSERRASGAAPPATRGRSAPQGQEAPRVAVARAPGPTLLLVASEGSDPNVAADSAPWAHWLAPSPFLEVPGG